MDRILPLLFPLLPMAGLAALAKRPGHRKKGKNGDSDVVVKDTGTKPGPGTPTAQEVTAHHTGVGAGHGKIYHTDRSPSCYEDASSSIDLRDVPMWTIEFGSGSKVWWDGKTIHVDFAKGGNDHKGSDDWAGDEYLDAIVLTTHALDGSVVSRLSHPIKDPKNVGFTIHLRKAGASGSPACHFT